jgi:hypothetical protein
MIISLHSHSQTVKELEYDLSWYSATEKDGDKISKARLLLNQDPFNYRAIDYICRYYNDRKIDSIHIFFHDLEKKYPNKSEPLILHAEFLSFEINYNDNLSFQTKKVEILTKALALDKSNSDIMYSLAKTYYEDFLRPTFKFPYSDYMVSDNERTPSVLINACDSALYYFKTIENFDHQLKSIVFFPIQQLEHYKGRLYIENVDPLLGIEENCYFPSWYFANLSEKWYSDLSVDYLFTMEMSKRSADGLKLQLVSLEEPCLYNLSCDSNSEIYRFTWLRSFDNPISIRLAKNGDKISLFWKIGKGSGGYEPEGIKRGGSKYLSIINYQKFIELFNHLNIEKRPNKTYVMMTDGATWTLEHKTNKSFKAINTNVPDDSLKKCCLYLLDLAKIKIDPKKIY